MSSTERVSWGRVGDRKINSGIDEDKPRHGQFSYTDRKRVKKVREKANIHAKYYVRIRRVFFLTVSVNGKLNNEVMIHKYIIKCILTGRSIFYLLCNSTVQDSNGPS